MEYKALNDEELALRIKSDDHQALSEIINRYQNKLFHYVLKLINSYDDAQDAVGQTFFKVYENIQGFDTQRKFSSWIYRICHNIAINLIKKNQRLSSVEAHTLDWLEDHHQEIEDFIEKEQRVKLSKEVVGLLDHIRPEYKEIIILYYFDEKSYEEISDILMIPESTVGVWLRRARQSIKKEIDKKIK